MDNIINLASEQSEPNNRKTQAIKDSLQTYLELAKSEAVAFGLNWQQPYSSFGPASVAKQLKQALHAPEHPKNTWNNLNPSNNAHCIELRAGDSVSALFAVAPPALRETIAHLQQKAVSEAVEFVKIALGAGTQGVIEPIAIAMHRCMEKGTTSMYTQLVFAERGANYTTGKLTTIDSQALKDAFVGAEQVYRTALANELRRELGLSLKKTQSGEHKIEYLMPELDRATQQSKPLNAKSTKDRVANVTRKGAKIVAVGQDPKIINRVIKHADQWQRVGEKIDFGKILYRTATTEHSITISDKDFKALEIGVLQSLIQTPGYVTSARVFSAVAIEASVHNLERSAVEWIARRMMNQYLRPTMTTEQGFQLYGPNNAKSIAEQVEKSTLRLERQAGMFCRMWQNTSQKTASLFQDLRSHLTSMKNSLAPVKEFFAQSVMKPTSEKDHEMLYRTSQISAWGKKYLDRQLQDLSERVSTLEKNARSQLTEDKQSLEHTKNSLKNDLQSSEQRERNDLHGISWA